jgi:hypothetical protein
MTLSAKSGNVMDIHSNEGKNSRQRSSGWAEEYDNEVIWLQPASDLRKMNEEVSFGLQTQNLFCFSLAGPVHYFEEMKNTSLIRSSDLSNVWKIAISMMWDDQDFYPLVTVSLLQGFVPVIV